MLIGAQIAGLVGVILAVPAATIVWVFASDIMKEKRERDSKLEDDTQEESQDISTS